VIGAEALVRWQHPNDGLIFPDDFIPIIENTGVINSLTHSVMDSALAWVGKWHKQGRELTVSVNLSPRSLHDADLPDRVLRTLAENEVPASALMLEITESAIIIDAEKAMKVVTELSQMGVGIAIDDFGTGYSSLAYLRRLPADEIKIDKSFVLNMDENADDASIVRSVIDLAKNLGKTVVAEGIENTDVWHILRGMDCDAGQGYHISRPIPADSFDEWLSGPAWKP
jgi:EAL domain-containing protein (putative c-di-GMP-specific phosphodiesterase class I)